ncbi:WD repeat-containing protein 48-like protein [Frankliniella fusca]|uniref:WD repeat-containing protein 48-like protein n=1 Tax=Frankliniella fusca TaxID=407009 RepID=A0AAE1LHI8_9NEOP|nr:WD repeat-containing protein 48-like protein [Frankliniella fusca]
MASTTRKTPSKTTLSVSGAAAAAAAAAAAGKLSVTSVTAAAAFPSKHRLISVSARSSVLGLGLSRTSRTSVLGVPANAQPVADGDLYLIDCINAKGALSVAYTKDNKLLAVGEASGNLRVFRTGKAEELCCLTLGMAVRGRAGGARGADQGPQGSGRAVAVTCLRPWQAEPSRPTVLAAYADGHVRLWDIKYGTVLQNAQEQRQTLGLAVSPDLRHFVSLGDDGSVFLYDAHTWQLLAKMTHSGFSDTVDGHKSRVLSGVFHPHDPNGIVTGGWDNVLQFWDVRLQNSVRHVAGTHIGGTESLDISPDGNEVMSCSWRNKDQLQIWDYGSAQLIETINPDNLQSYTVGTVTGLAHGIYSIALGPVGAKYVPNPALNSGRNMLSHVTDKCPRVAVCSDNKVIELEIY